MRSRYLIVATLLTVSFPALAENSVFEKRPFAISNEDRNLMVENTQLRLLQESTVQAYHRQPDLGFGFFIGSTGLKDQKVKMNDNYTAYKFSDIMSVGIDIKKDLYAQYFGLGFQLEYETYRNSVGALHILPVTAYGFGRTRGFSKFAIKGVAEVGYTNAYVRQMGTVERSGGLGAAAGFWQAGLEIPFKSTTDLWAMGLFYSERFAPEKDFDLSGRTIKLQGSITL